MRILFVSSVFPQPGNETRGTYCRSLCEALAEQNDVRVVSAVCWHERVSRKSARVARMTLTGRESRTGEVFYPTFFYPPGVLRRSHRWFMYRSIQPSIKRI